jgi:hypothetical protein
VALSRTACAAFSKEKRFANAIKLNRKSRVVVAMAFFGRVVALIAHVGPILRS